MPRPKLPYRKLKERESVTELSPSKELIKVRKGLGRVTADSSPSVWLDTGSEHLNAVLGSREFGAPFGRIYEISGPESHGKSALALELAGLAQQQTNAIVILYDAEGSFDPDWGIARGLDVHNDFHYVEPYMTEEKGKREFVNSAHIFTELEHLIELLNKKYSDRPIVLIVDSMAALVSPDEASSELESYTMRESTSLSRFLSGVFRRWLSIVRNHNVMMLCINQLREKPGTMFGDPRYTPGGRGLRHAASVRVRMARMMGKSGQITQASDVVGAKGLIENVKNKAGHGSVEKEKCGFKLFFSLEKNAGKKSQYMDAKQVKRKD